MMVSKTDDMFGIFSIKPLNDEARFVCDPSDTLYFSFHAAQAARSRLEDDLDLHFQYGVSRSQEQLPLLPFIVAEDGTIERLYEEPPRYDAVLTADYGCVAIDPDATTYDEDGAPESVQDWNGVRYNDGDIAYYVGVDEDITTDMLLEAWGLGVNVPVHLDGIDFSFRGAKEQGGVVMLDEFDGLTVIPAEDDDLNYEPYPDGFAVPADIDGYGNPFPFDIDEELIIEMTEAGCFECDDTDCPVWSIANQKESR